MSDDYLWNGQGEAEPEVARLEALLAPLAHDGRPLPLDDVQLSGSGVSMAPAPLPLPIRGRLSHPRSIRVAVALAASLLAIAAGVLWLRGARPRAWAVSPLSGTPRIGTRALTGADHLARGEWLVTDDGASARLAVGRIGVVDIEPRTRVQLLGLGGHDHRLALAEGTLHAIITAPPRQFFVETPSALTTDLGCAYTLEVDSGGNGMLTVDAGWVSVAWHGRESFIPAGARCLTRTGEGPGTPYSTDAAAAFKNALLAFDLGIPAMPRRGLSRDSVRAEGLRDALANARKEDAFTLWHLLASTGGAERGLVFDALAARVPPPATVTRAGILAGSVAMRDAWWDALGFGATREWRRWQRPWWSSGRPS